MEVEWVQRPAQEPVVIYAFKSHTEYAGLEQNVSAVRGRCIAYARRLDEGGWEVKLAGPKHLVFKLPSREKAYRKLTRLVTAQSDR